jgi:putative ATPase
MDLFEQRARAFLSKNAPLAERMRPVTLDEVLGQPDVIGEQSALRAILSTGELRSLIFWGPPGTGKTTLARLIAQTTKAHFIQLSATGSGVKEVRAAIEDARARLGADGQRTILFIDEIHRFNKNQQDTLLHSMEDGTITVLGATTENPSFEVNGAILSRCRLVVLKHLEEPDLRALIARALSDTDRGLGAWQLSLTPDAEQLILQYAQGDARSLLNALELAAIRARADQATAGTAGPVTVTEEQAAGAIGRQALLYDKTGEEHYNLASALIKSMRGSDPDAAIYYTVRMLAGGESPRFVARRMAIFASEDIGNADPGALVQAASAITIVELIGMPEAYFTLGALAAYLALAPKSNATKLALGAAKELVSKHGPLPTPLEIRNAPTKLMKGLGYGANAPHPHEDDDGISPMGYLPDKIAGTRLYEPVDRGFERELRRRVDLILARRTGQPPAQ